VLLASAAIIVFPSTRGEVGLTLHRTLFCVLCFLTLVKDWRAGRLHMTIPQLYRSHLKAGVDTWLLTGLNPMADRAFASVTSSCDTRASVRSGRLRARQTVVHDPHQKAVWVRSSFEVNRAGPLREPRRTHAPFVYG
jgi:hypothetical protein